MKARIRNNDTIKCCICGAEIPVVESNNPYPVREWSRIGTRKNRCCNICNGAIVIPMRESMLNLSEQEQKEFHEKLLSMSYEELNEFDN